MVTIKAGADNVGSLELTLEKRRGMVIDALPSPMDKLLADTIGRNLITLVDLHLIALESPSPRETLAKLESLMQMMKSEIGSLQRPGSRPSPSKETKH